MVRSKRSANQRRSRLAFLWAFAFFLVLQLAGGVVLDWCGLPIRFPTAYQVLEQATQRTAEQAAPPDIVCLGSSRFMFGLPEADWQPAMDRYHSPGHAVRVCNAAVPAGDQISSELILNQLLVRGVCPKYAVIEVTAESLNHYNAWLGTHVRRQLGWSDLPVYFGEICCALQVGDLLKSRFLPLWLHRKQLFQEGIDGANLLWCRYGLGSDEGIDVENVLDELMHSITDSNLTPDELTRNGLKQIRTLLRHYAVGGTSAAALDRTLDRCRENGIHVLLVRPPLSRWHRELYTPEIETAFLAHIHHLTATYGCTFADYASRVRDDWFIDNHHLKPEGGRAFSELLAREVLGPQVQEGRPIRISSSPEETTNEQR